MDDEPFESLFGCLLAGIFIGSYVDELRTDTSMLRLAEVMDMGRRASNVSADELRRRSEQELLHDADVDITNLENLFDGPLAGKCGLAGEPSIDIFRRRMQEIRNRISTGDFNAAADAARELRNVLFSFNAEDTARVRLE